MKNSVLLSILLLFSISLFAQQETNNWVYGGKAGITWNTTRSFNARGIHGTPNKTFTDMPTDIGATSINTFEGCFSISGFDGKLLFYSDGMTIWNSTHAVMKNGTGLTGDISSSQSGIVIPYPGRPLQFIVLTMGLQGANNLVYCVVNMELENGLGAVVEGEKNIRLVGHKGTIGENFSSLRHANGKDYWIVAAGKGSSTTYMNAWLVTADGVLHTAPQQSTPMSATIRPSHSGYLKFTADGKHFAMASWVSADFIIFGDFDSNTGKFSNLKSRKIQVSRWGAYGVEFSESGKYLYLTTPFGSAGNNHHNTLFAFDFEALMAAPNPNTVNPVKKIENPANSGQYFGAIQLGPDGKMYIANIGLKSLAMIDNPEDPANMNLYILDNFTTGNAWWGLPSFSASWFGGAFSGNTYPCMEQKEIYKLKVIEGEGFEDFAYTIWNFGDGSPNAIKPPNSDITQEQSYSHIYLQPGKYTLTIKFYDTNDNEITSARHTSVILVGACHIPVNPHLRITH